ncbi:cytochrome P450 [Delitschia confertaspora ATCC 74209]|uniref:Cytochrome P450 n=1 Tax=Delitschia confertaspora ATCC 74209 TaxID=1513339 RepID=A0A9P4MTC8_9PLEO|nr:cytochrome P450 [Delitschia confertaspora ATCC 74209]
MPNLPASVISGFMVLYGLFQFLLRYTQDPCEPPPVATSIPFLGPIIGLMRKQHRYYVELWEKYHLPIYTLRMPDSRIYVVNSAALISNVQRQFKVLAFPPLEAKLSAKACASSKTAHEILMTNVNGDEGYWGYSITFHNAILPGLSPGPGLDAMNRVMVQKISASADRLEKPRTVWLYEFIEHEIALATTDSVYGPANPFKDPTVEQRFWKFRPAIMLLIMDLPMFAKEGVEAREYMVKAFTKYFESHAHNEGSTLVQVRYEHSREHKIPVEDIARYEVGNSIGILTNTVPASFWMMYHLFSDPVVLHDCRNELLKIVSDAPDANELNLRTLDISQVKNSCPILVSTLQEVLRVHTVGISTRMVMEDHMLDNKYLLTKGSTLMMPGPVQHSDKLAWGPTVNEFDHRHFVRHKDLKDNKRHNPVAFRAFGGGTTLCPGRHFASTEILAFMAIMILRFGVTPVKMKAPDEDIEVRITPGGEDKNLKWRIVVTDSEKRAPLSVEDLES